MPKDHDASRRQVLWVFTTEAVAGFLIVVWVTLAHAAETRRILAALGENAPLLVALFFLYASILALLRFALTDVIFVSLVITAFISMFPLLGVVLSAWIAIVSVFLTRIIGMLQIGPSKVDMTDPTVQVVRTFGFFGTYGIPVVMAGLLYEAIGGSVPATTVTGAMAWRAAIAGLALILANNALMFPVQLAYGYSLRKSLKLSFIDTSICLLTLPYAVCMTFSYHSIGVGAVIVFAFTGILANAVGRNLAITRGASQQQLQRLASLTNIGKTISLRFATDQLLTTIYAECKKVIDVSNFSIALLDETSNELSFELDVFNEQFLPRQRIPVGEGLNSWVVTNRRPLLIGSVKDERRLGIVSVDDGVTTESWLGAPMISRDRVIGVISLQSYRKNAFTYDDMILLTAIANQTAVALENAHLYKDLEGLTFALEHRVQQRTNELREANLRLMAADRSKNQFLANMSHELRTPLNSIIGFSDVLLGSTRDALPARFYRFLENIRAAGTHLLELINDILDLSKIEAGKMQLRPEQFDVRETLASVERVMRGFADDAHVQLQIHVDDAVPQVTLDEGRLKQILFNLVSNAVKFSPAGGHVAVDVRMLDPMDSPLSLPTLRVDVTDEGIGIRQDELNRIFDEFYQTEEGRKSGRGGTGLGLSLARNFIELHFGRIEVTSTPGRGSSFTMLLPADYPTALNASVRLNLPHIAPSAN